MQPFKTHINNLAQIRAHIRAFGPTWFHGDGNCYTADEHGGQHSGNNVEFSNPGQEEAKHRVKFSAEHEVPDTVHELNQLLLKAKQAEAQAGRAATVNHNSVKTFTVDGPARTGSAPDELETLRAELARLKAEKQALADAHHTND